MATQGYWRNRNLCFRDSVHSRASNELWETCPLEAIRHDPNMALVFTEDWSQYNATDIWTLTQQTAGSAAISIAESGVLELAAGSSTATQGPNLQRTSGPFIVPAANQDIWAEFEFKIVDTYDKAELFVGLSEVDTTIIATSANSSANHIGWQCVTDNGVLLFTTEKAGAGATSACATIAEATHIKLGVHVTGITSAQQYVNGVATGTAHVTAKLPIVKLVPSFVCQSGGTNSPVMHLRHFTIVQLKP